MLEWFGRLDSELVCALLERWPALEELQTGFAGEPAHFLS
jgi:hypothetical protein